MIGMQDHHGQWWKVVKDCIRCGQCCMDSPPSWEFAQDDIVGGCTFLKEQEDGTYLCGLKGYRPFGCCCNDPHTIPKYCSVVLEKIDDPVPLLQM